jgi:hypothetical protein
MFLGTLLRAAHSYGGDERNRTADPLLAKQVLSQLSYIPTENFRLVIFDCRLANRKIVNRQSSIPVVGLPGIEPGTSRLSSVRSSQLS